MPRCLANTSKYRSLTSTSARTSAHVQPGGSSTPASAPRLDLLPRFGAEKTLAELLFELIESLASSRVAIAVDAEQDDLHPAP